MENRNKTSPRKLFQDIALVGPAIFLERLVPKEKLQEYLHFTRANARDFLLLRLLTEVQKVGFVLKRWNDFLDCRLPGSPQSAADEQELESLIDEQSLWQRKLIEGLVLLINFVGTNELTHYYHFLLLQELERYKGMLKEQQDFFQYSNSLTQRTVKLLTERIELVETEIGSLVECWYLPKDKPLTKRRLRLVLASFRQQYKSALPKTTRRERRALVYTYSLSYGETSGNIHFNAIRSDVNDLEKRFSFGLAQCGLLVVAILRRAHELSGLKPEGINTILMNLDKDIFSDNDPTLKKLEIGDFVLADGPFLGEVVSVTTSTFGYESYQIRYLADTPLEDINEAWFPSVEVHLFMKRKELIESVLAELRKNEDEARTTTLPISDVSEEDLEQATKDAVIEIWRTGLSKYYKRTMEPRCKGNHGLGYPPDLIHV